MLTIGLNRAVSLLAEPRQGRRGGRTPLTIVGDHPDDGAPITLYRGRYGPYVSHGGINATLPRDLVPEEVTLERSASTLLRGAGRRKDRRRQEGAEAKAKRSHARKDRAAPWQERAPPRKPIDDAAHETAPS